MKGYHSTASPEKMSLEECLELGRRSAEGDPAARETLILSHIYIVDIILSTFRNKGVDTDDLYQEGCYGLLKAVDLYDHKRGVLFSTYATYWVRKQMRIALRKQRTNNSVILSDDDFWLLMKVLNVMNRWMKKYEFKPSCEDIANELNMTEEQIIKLLNMAAPYVNTNDLLIVTKKTGSTSCISGHSAEDEFFSRFVFLNDIPLTEREKTILTLHLDLTNANREESLKEIAAKLQLSYETVRQNYRSALQKIKTKILKYNNI